MIVLAYLSLAILLMMNCRGDQGPSLIRVNRSVRYTRREVKWINFPYLCAVRMDRIRPNGRIEFIFVTGFIINKFTVLTWPRHFNRAIRMWVVFGPGNILDARFDKNDPPYQSYGNRVFKHKVEKWGRHPHFRHNQHAVEHPIGYVMIYEYFRDESRYRIAALDFQPFDSNTQLWAVVIGYGGNRFGRLTMWEAVGGTYLRVYYNTYFCCSKISCENDLGAPVVLYGRVIGMFTTLIDKAFYGCGEVESGAAYLIYPSKEYLLALQAGRMEAWENLPRCSDPDDLKRAPSKKKRVFGWLGTNNSVAIPPHRRAGSAVLYIITGSVLNTYSLL